MVHIYPPYPYPKLISASRSYSRYYWQHQIPPFHRHRNLRRAPLSPQEGRKRRQIWLHRRAGTQPSAAMAIFLGRQRCSIPGPNRPLCQIKGQDFVYVYTLAYIHNFIGEADSIKLIRRYRTVPQRNPSPCTACLTSIFRVNSRENQESISLAMARENILSLISGHDHGFSWGTLTLALPSKKWSFFLIFWNGSPELRSDRLSRGIVEGAYPSKN